MQVVGYKDKKHNNEFEDRMQELADLGQALAIQP
jgi:hypothetical protein